MTNLGPWSIDWLNDHYDEEAGIVFSTKKKKVQSKKVKAVVGSGSDRVTNKRKKNGGVSLYFWQAIINVVNEVWPKF